MMMLACTHIHLNLGFSTAVDLAPVLAASFAAGTCALLGSTLILRKQAMLGDAISHSILPGLVLAFAITQVRSGFAMIVGAMIAAMASALCVSAVSRLTKLDRNASMGVVFSIFFALGVVLIKIYASQVDLDPGCVLYGSLESLLWPRASSLAALTNIDTWLDAPRQLGTLAIVALITLAIFLALSRQIRLYCFDQALMRAMGQPAGFIAALLLTLTVAATVASFEAVGSILIIALLVGPPLAARQLTDRFNTQLILAVVLGVLCAIGGYFAASFGPELVSGQKNTSVSAPGMIAVTTGFVLACAIVARNLRAKPPKTLP